VQATLIGSGQRVKDALASGTCARIDREYTPGSRLRPELRLDRIWSVAAILTSVSDLSDRFQRQARNEALFREVNERIAELGEQAQAWSPDGTVEFLCECGQEGGCGERVAMPFAEYERVRRQDDRFVVFPGHESPEIERVVHSTDDYVIVDKLMAVEPLVEDDPRGAPSS
jgi:hypothetical protein